MITLHTSLPALDLLPPDPERDAPFALSWFEAPHGKETLLLMGNAEEDIHPPTLQGETATLASFLELEKANKQLTWMLRIDNKTIGAAWINLTEEHGVEAPSVHIMIGDKSYRGHGIGKAVMQAMIEYAAAALKAPVVFSRHLKSNVAVAGMNQTLGFENDGPSYTDEQGLEWQNVKRRLQTDTTQQAL